MEKEKRTFRIILEKPVTGVRHGVQKGKGNNYDIKQQQTLEGHDLKFEIDLEVRKRESTPVIFGGPYV